MGLLMAGWRVVFELATGGSAPHIDPDGHSLQLLVEAETAPQALRQGLDHWREAIRANGPSWRITRVEVVAQPAGPDRPEAS